MTNPKELYRWSRDLHLYCGLFISPFLLVFATSVFFLNHGKFTPSPEDAPRTVRELLIPSGIDQLQGLEAVNAARALLPQLGLTGEIGFLRILRKERRLVFPVAKPGYEATVDVNMESRSASVSTRSQGWWEVLAYLHKSPGPHNVNIRGNWFWTRAWGWLADSTIYLTLFVSITGVYLWYAIKAERTVGLWLLGAGATTFLGTIYAIVK